MLPPQWFTTSENGNGSPYYRNNGSFWEVDDFTRLGRTQLLSYYLPLAIISSIGIFALCHSGLSRYVRSAESDLVNEYLFGAQEERKEDNSIERLLRNSNTQANYVNVKKQGRTLKLRHFDITTIDVKQIDAKNHGGLTFSRPSTSDHLRKSSEIVLMSLQIIGLSFLRVTKINIELTNRDVTTLLLFWLILLSLSILRVYKRSTNLWAICFTAHTTIWISTWIPIRSVYIGNIEDVPSQIFYIFEFVITSTLQLIKLTSPIKDNSSIIYVRDDHTSPSREHISSILSCITWSWITNFIWEAQKNTIKLKDIWGLSMEDYSIFILKGFTRRNKHINNLTLALFESFKTYLLIGMLWVLVNSIVNLLPTILMKRFLEIVDNPNRSSSCMNLAWLYIIGMFICRLTLAIFVVGLLFNFLGVSAFAGISIILVMFPLNFLLANLLGKFQKQTLQCTDQRISKLNECLQNIRIVKYFAWERNIINEIKSIRQKELRSLLKKSLVWSVTSFLWFVTPTLVTGVTFAIYTFVQHEDLNAPLAFTTLSLFTLLKTPLDQLSNMLSYINQSKVSLKRISDFLRMDDTEKYNQLTISPDKNKIEFKNATLTWNENDSDMNAFKLCGLNIKFQIGKLNLVLGSTGSGKSALLLGLLGELNLISGSIIVPSLEPRHDLIPDCEGLTNSFAYCSQSAWLLNDTVKNNIIFDNFYNEDRYNKVIDACGLKRDLKILPAGDLTEIGEKGITLSGGQKQRISLARAVYSSAKHVLLDDCLSAVDSHTAVWIYENCITEEEEKSNGAISLDVYKWYLKFFGGFKALTALFALYITAQILFISQSWWIRHWVNDTNVRINAPGFAMDTLPLKGMTDSSKNKHNAFYYLTVYFLIGIIQAMLGGFKTMMTFLSVAVIVFVLYFFVGKWYLTASRELKRLDSITKSPIFQHFSETLAGVCTIRAFGDERRFILENMNKIDQNNRAFFYLSVTVKWFSFRVDMIGAFIVLASGSFILLNIANIDSGLAGISLTYAILFTDGALWLVRLYSTFEMNMNSVERLKEYSSIEQENYLGHDEGRILLLNEPSWPKDGEIEIENLSLRYAPNLPPVIRNVSFKVDPQSKIGIVGRTGAGKSTIITALFRLLEPITGCIKIDGQDISKIDLVTLRRSITIIPQDPILFAGTIKKVLNSEERFNSTHNKFLNLQTEIAEGGLNLSQGERQLLFIARSLLREPKIILLDEATSSIDYDSDHLIQGIIRSEFNKSTILTIAHRLRSVIDYDRIIVMDAGEVKEYDRPSELLKNERGIFYSMCRDSGDLELLKQIAKQSSKRMK
ncbi:ATP-binding cassette multidrug transporter [Saccharomyces cerevisiae]|nr:ATP-binding cassette multidrug transporter [Saccharomyces cerevisiae]